MPAQAPITIKMKRARDTKNKRVFEAESSSQGKVPVDSIYAWLWFAAGAEEIELTIKILK